MKILIRNGTTADLPAIASLVQELALHEGSLPELELSADQLVKDGAGPAPSYSTLLAVSEQGEILGMALYFFAYSSWKGKTLYLEDLYLRPAVRGIGIGKQLIEKLKEAAKAGGARRLLLQAHAHNKEALAFYQHLGAHLDDSWVNCSLPL